MYRHSFNSAIVGHRDYGTGTCINPECQAKFVKHTEDQEHCGKIPCQAYAGKRRKEQRNTSVGTTDNPVGIQRKRVAGWKKPPHTVIVTRPGKYGNPYKVEDFGLELSLKLFENTARGVWDPPLTLADGLIHEAYEHHQAWLRRIGGHPVEIIRSELKGKNLACWCQIGTRCHRDILLKIANEGSRQ